MSNLSKRDMIEIIEKQQERYSGSYSGLTDYCWTEERKMAKILIVEDDKEIHRLLCEYLPSRDYEVINAVNGRCISNCIKDKNRCMQK